MEKRQAGEGGGDAEPAVWGGLPERALIDRVRAMLEREQLTDALDLFNDLHPVDQGEVLFDLPPDSQQDLLAEITPEQTADILEHLTADEATQLSEQMQAPSLADVLDEASPDVAADVLRGIPRTQSAETLAAMEDASDVVPLLQYPDDTAGGLMSSAYVSVRLNSSAGMALDSVRLQSLDVEHAEYVLVLDESGGLAGVLDLVRLALARPSLPVMELTNTGVVSVTPDTDQEDCARLVHRYELDALPVVDEENFLRGVVFGEDLVSVLEEEATEDMYRLAAVEGEAVFGPIVTSLRSRLPWLYVNLATVGLAVLVIGLFESTIARVVMLAVFLPVVPGQGGMGGIQTLTLVVRSMALGEVPGHRGYRLIGRELLLGAIQGLLLGIAVGVVAYLWKGSIGLSLALGLSMLANMIMAGLTGAGVPLLLRRLGLDPAVSSAVFITTVTDVFGLLMFLGVATALLGIMT